MSRSTEYAIDIDDVDSLWRLTLEQRLEQERNQAEIDRREFRSTVEAVLDVLRDRFTSNGHGD